MRLGKVLRRSAPNPHAAARDVIVKQSSNFGRHAVPVHIPVPTCMAQELTLLSVTETPPELLCLWADRGERRTPVRLQA
jgi:hypothetical protein